MRLGHPMVSCHLTLESTLDQDHVHDPDLISRRQAPRLVHITVRVPRHCPFKVSAWEVSRVFISSSAPVFDLLNGSLDLLWELKDVVAVLRLLSDGPQLVMRI